MRILIKSLEGELLGAQNIEQFPCIVGRSNTCDISISNSRISSNHLEINFQNHELILKDLSSSNGTFLGNERITEYQSRDSIEINLGQAIILEFQMEPTVAIERPTSTNATNAVVPIAVDDPPLEMYRNNVMKPSVIRPQFSKKPLSQSTSLGWSYYWHILENFSVRKFFLLSLGAIFFFLMAHIYVFESSIEISLLLASIVGVTSLAGGFFVSLLLAAVGYLFRGAFNFKALFYVQSALVYFMCLESIVLQPASLIGTIGYFAIALTALLGVLGAFSSSYIQMFNLFPHRWDKKLAIVALVFGIMGAGSAVKIVILRDRNDVLKYMVLTNQTNSKSLAGSVIAVRDLASEMRDFAKK